MRENTNLHTLTVVRTRCMHQFCASLNSEDKKANCSYRRQSHNIHLESDRADLPQGERTVFLGTNAWELLTSLASFS